MSAAATPVDARLAAWLDAVGWRELPLQVALRAHTDALAEGGMRSSAGQVALLQLLIGLIGATRVLEIGCFTGYGTLAMALALAPDGRIVTLDAEPRFTEVGRPFWREAGVADRIELRLGLAADSLAALGTEGAVFDLAYVDADKKGYDGYYEAALRLVRPGGIVALDNMLWGGRVADPGDDSHQTRALRDLTRKIHADPRVEPCLVPIGDGLLLARRL